MCLKAEAVPGEAGLLRCSAGEEGPDQLSGSLSVLTLKELLFFLHAGEEVSICHYISVLCDWLSEAAEGLQWGCSLRSDYSACHVKSLLIP